jgi:hypothetical protein
MVVSVGDKVKANIAASLVGVSVLKDSSQDLVELPLSVGMIGQNDRTVIEHASRDLI